MSEHDPSITLQPIPLGPLVHLNVAIGRLQVTLELQPERAAQLGRMLIDTAAEATRSGAEEPPP